MINRRELPSPYILFDIKIGTSYTHARTYVPCRSGNLNTDIKTQFLPTSMYILRLALLPYFQLILIIVSNWYQIYKTRTIYASR